MRSVPAYPSVSRFVTSCLRPASQACHTVAARESTLLVQQSSCDASACRANAGLACVPDCDPQAILTILTPQLDYDLALNSLCQQSKAKSAACSGGRPCAQPAPAAGPPPPPLLGCRLRLRPPHTPAAQVPAASHTSFAVAGLYRRPSFRADDWHWCPHTLRTRSYGSGPTRTGEQDERGWLHTAGPTGRDSRGQRNSRPGRNATDSSGSRGGAGHWEEHIVGGRPTNGGSGGGRLGGGGDFSRTRTRAAGRGGGGGGRGGDPWPGYGHQGDSGGPRGAWAPGRGPPPVPGAVQALQQDLWRVTSWQGLELAMRRATENCWLNGHTLDLAATAFNRLYTRHMREHAKGVSSVPQVAAVGPPPPDLAGQLRWLLTRRAQEQLSCREVGHLLGALVQPLGAPPPHPLAAPAAPDAADSHGPVPYLLRRLEQLLTYTANSLDGSDAASRTSAAGAAALPAPAAAGPEAGAGAAAEPRPESSRIPAPVSQAHEAAGRTLSAQSLCLVLSALRRHQVATPAIYTAAARVARHLMERDLVGESLVLTILAFAKADNPVPWFLDLALRAAVRPQSLSQLDSPFLVCVLFTAAARTGMPAPDVLGPLSSKLIEQLRAARGLRNQGAALPATEAAALEPTTTAGSGGGNDHTGDAQNVKEGEPSRQRRPWAFQRPLQLKPSELLHVLQACGTLGHRDDELLSALLEEVVANAPKWSVLVRLKAAQHLAALGRDVVGCPHGETAPPRPPGEQQQQPQSPARQEQGLQQLGSDRQGPSALAASLPEKGQAADALGSDPPDRGATHGSSVIVTEEEVLAHLLRPELKVTDLLDALHALARLRSRLTASAGPAATAESDAVPAPAPQATAHVMPAALATAVQRVDAAAPMLPARLVSRALSALTSAGIPAPMSVLLRAQDLYAEHQAAAARAAAAAASSWAAGAGGAAPAPATDAVGQHGYDHDEDEDDVDHRHEYEDDRAAAPLPPPPAQQVGEERNAAAPPPAAAAGPGHRPGRSPARDVAAMCAVVGRGLAWQPNAAAAAHLRPDFVAHCREAALRGK